MKQDRICRNCTRPYAIHESKPCNQWIPGPALHQIEVQEVVFKYLIAGEMAFHICPEIEDLRQYDQAAIICLNADGSRKKGGLMGTVGFIASGEDFHLAPGIIAFQLWPPEIKVREPMEGSHISADKTK